MKTNTARTAVYAGLAAVMALSSMPIPAMAEVTYGRGNVTINKNVSNHELTYDGYQIFKANVQDDKNDETGKSETNVNWASDAVKTAVEDIIKKTDPNYDGKTAQDAAEFINEHITNTTSKGDSHGTVVADDSFADKLAEAVDSVASTTSLTPGIQSSLDEGWWLFVTNKDATDSKQDTTGTAPIFLAVGGSDVTVSEKTSVPTVSKSVTDDATSAGVGVIADADTSQGISYHLEGTVSDNIANYKTYKYKFTDTLNAGLDANTDSVTVKVDGTEVAKDSNYTLTYENHVLTIDFTDLKSVGIDITKDTVVTVDYTASLNENAVLGGIGNKNEVQLTYSNNPYSDGTGTSTPKETHTFAYQLKLHKIDRTTEVNLAGAKFTIQATGADENDKGKYVQSDGSLGNEVYEFATDADGLINVKGLDKGTYTVTETTAPDGYDVVAPFTFEIVPTYNNDSQSLTDLDVKLTATDSVIAGDTDKNTADNVMKASNSNQTDASTGTVNVTVGDVKRLNIVQTGLGGIPISVYAVGGVVVSLALGHLIVSRKRDAE